MNARADKVSILVPVYNRAHCIVATLECALAQTHANLEVVVVDNASTDASWALIVEVAARDSRVRAFRNESNIGPVRNWLKCVSHASGDYGKILWSDDLMHPEFLARALPHLADPEVGFVYSPARIFASDDPRIGTVYYDTPPAGRSASSEFIEGILLARDYPVSPGCALFRLQDLRDCLQEQVPNRVGSDFAMHAIGNDALLFLLVAARYRHCWRLDEPLNYFRHHEGSITVSAARGKIPLNYAIAKAYFVSRCPPPARVVKRFNAILLVNLLVFRGNTLGISRLADFYPEDGRHPASITYFLRYVLAELGRRLPGGKKA